MAPFLCDTLESIKVQDYTNFEVIMVDDGSTDGTLALMQRYVATDHRFKAIALDDNQGVVAARNVALANSHGEYVAMLDGDDIWTSDALSERLAVAHTYRLADVIATDYATFVDQPSTSPVGKIGLGRRARKEFSDSFATAEPILLDNPFELLISLHFAWVGATLIRRCTLNAIGGFDPKFTGPEDGLLWARLAQCTKFAFTPRVTAHYRQRPGSLSTNFGGPIALHHLKVLNWVRGMPEFVKLRPAIKRVSAAHHHVCALYYRGRGEYVKALRHAAASLVNEPFMRAYWYGFAAAALKQ